ncbi:hypothetical protein Pla110_32260 [Polystyrenella longa]|uniref:Uncharacterized protein n=1 Tax=Polystyrenella longa TaxID=2528007 RepID=A0A518CQK8_9PLAN|nr:hypothetical protein [Polystyrenella longa]QDU81484.1 hypothetical protein Pla110_32260 [Polystyrenella longa]
MSTNAKVHSFEAIKRFHGSLIIFAEEATGSLGSLHQEIVRIMQWLTHEQPSYWKKQIQKGFEEVAAAKAALSRAKMKNFDGNPASCIEEKKALQKAKWALDHAQKQIDVVRHWGIKMQQESDEYRGRLARLETMVNLEIPRMLALLENMVTALEAYAAIQTVETNRMAGNDEQSRQQRAVGNKQAQEQPAPKSEEAVSTETAAQSAAQPTNQPVPEEHQ